MNSPLFPKPFIPATTIFLTCSTSYPLFIIFLLTSSPHTHSCPGPHMYCPVSYLFPVWVSDASCSLPLKISSGLSWWLVYDLFVNFHNFFMTCSWLFNSCSWFVNNLFITCSWLVHYMFTICSYKGDFTDIWNLFTILWKKIRIFHF